MDVRSMESKNITVWNVGPLQGYPAGGSTLGTQEWTILKTPPIKAFQTSVHEPIYRCEEFGEQKASKMQKHGTKQRMNNKSNFEGNYFIYKNKGKKLIGYPSSLSCLVSKVCITTSTVGVPPPSAHSPVRWESPGFRPCTPAAAVRGETPVSPSPKLPAVVSLARIVGGCSRTNIECFIDAQSIQQSNLKDSEKINYYG
jgi:hypothetical protein